MITISKPKRLAIIMMTSLLLLPVVHAVDYTKELPTNTLFYEDFNSSTSFHSNTADNCIPGQTTRNTTIAFPGNTGSLWEKCSQSGVVQDAHWSIAWPGDIIGCAVYMTGGEQVMNQTANSGVAAPSCEFWDAGNHWEAKLEYSPRLCTWQWLWGGPGTGDSTTTTTLIKLCIPTEEQTSNPVTAQIAQTWVPVKIIIQKSTHVWVSISIAGTTYPCSTLISIVGSRGCEIRSIAAGGAGWTPNLFNDEELSVSSGTTTVLNAFHFDNVLMTDETGIVTPAFSAAKQLWQAVAAMGSMMSVVTMYSSVRAYQEPDRLRRRMKLMVAVVFAVGAGTLAVFAIILSRL